MRVNVGALMALRADGAEDQFLFDEGLDDIWDVRRRFLRHPYATAYDKLGGGGFLQEENAPRCECPPESARVSFAIPAGEGAPADMVNELDLVLALDAEDPPIAALRLIRSVEVRCADRRIDGWEGTDVATLIETMCAVFGRKLSRHGDRLFVPLALAPFHSHNLLSLVRSAASAASAALSDARPPDVVVTVEFVDAASASASAAELYGRTYFLSPKARRRAALAYQMGSAYSQWGGDHPFPRSLSGMKHHLSFDHPVSMLMFWGVDKATLTSVSLQLNGRAFYDGPLAPLERVKEQRGLGHVEPVVVFFSQDPPSSPFQSTVNFSRIDSVTVVLRTRTRTHTTADMTDGGHPDPVVRYYAVSVHPLHVADGTCSRVFENGRVRDMFPEYGPTVSIEEALG